jgi:hypothetical protein
MASIIFWAIFFTNSSGHPGGHSGTLPQKMHSIKILGVLEFYQNF